MPNSKKRFVIAAATFLCVALAAGGWLLANREHAPEQDAMAEYRLENLSCGSCVRNIENALNNLTGVSSVEVNLTSNRGRVTFDPQLTDSESIAATISAAGYPARLRTELSPDEYLSLGQEQEQLGQQYLARIGERLLARSDFEAIVQQRNATTPPELRALWSEVVQRELLLSAAAQNGILVQEGEIDLRLAELQQQHAGFEKLIATRYPDRTLFRAQLREDMIIQRNLDQYVFSGLTSQSQKQQRFQQWFTKLQDSTEVVIFDPEIKALTTGGSGCGGSCCS